MSFQDHKIAVIVPCFRVRNFILSVLDAMGEEVDMVFVVDDACPEDTGDYVSASVSDPRAQVIRHKKNVGVGGATLTGYRAAIAQGADILVKVDGDGQMNPSLIPLFLEQLLGRDADYVKGNRFYRLENARGMPRTRLVGNLTLSFLTKISSGYWQVVDPTNGFTALRADVACELPFEELDEGYFFESDMLFHLNLLRAVVLDVPMRAVYGDEQSNLKVSRVLPEFFAKNLRNAWRRIIRSYFVREFTLGSAELLGGLLFFIFGISFGAYAWIRGAVTETLQSSGTVMLAALPTLVGLQLLIAFLHFDVLNTPKSRLIRPDALQLRQAIMRSVDVEHSHS